MVALTRAAKTVPGHALRVSGDHELAVLRLAHDRWGSSVARAGLQIKHDDTSFFLGRETLLTTGRSGISRWRKALFAFLSRNAQPATAFFGIPPNRVVEMGTQIEL